MTVDAQQQPTSNVADDVADDAVRSYTQLSAELCEYVEYYLAVRLDQMRLAMRRAVLWWLVVAIATFMALTLVGTALVLGLDGLAAGLGEALGGRMWLGKLLTGIGGLLAAGICLAAISSYLRRQWITKIQSKYAARRDEERQRFGRDVAQ